MVLEAADVKVKIEKRKEGSKEDDKDEKERTALAKRTYQYDPRREGCTTAKS